MIEPIMYLAIGFLISTLCALALAPLVHNRAVRLTTRRLEAATPVSMAEIQADKDQLRAEFAMSARRLEISVEQLKNKTTSQLAELGKKADAINRMKIELGEKSATIFALEAREKGLKEQIRTTEEEFNARTETLRAAEQALTDKQNELAKINRELSDRSTTAESRQVELVAVRAQIEQLKNQVGDAEKQFSATQTRLVQERSESEAASHELSEARSRVDSLSQRVKELDNENNELRQAAQKFESTTQALRDEITLLYGGRLPEIEKLRTEKAAVEEQLRVAHDERQKLQNDINAIQQQAENSWATERMENALLRERINDIAAEVATLAMQLEGPNSPIEALLATERAAAPKPPAHKAKAADGSTAPALPENSGTLADRIRALQAHASRAHQQGS